MTINNVIVLVKALLSHEIHQSWNRSVKSTEVSIDKVAAYTHLKQRRPKPLGQKHVQTSFTSLCRFSTQSVIVQKFSHDES